MVLGGCRSLLLLVTTVEGTQNRCLCFRLDSPVILSHWRHLPVLFVAKPPLYHFIPCAFSPRRLCKNGGCKEDFFYFLGFVIIPSKFCYHSFVSFVLINQFAQPLQTSCLQRWIDCWLFSSSRNDTPVSIFVVVRGYLYDSFHCGLTKRLCD